MLKKIINKNNSNIVENICLDVIAFKADTDEMLVTEIAVAIFSVKRDNTNSAALQPRIGKMDYQIIKFKVRYKYPYELDAELKIDPRESYFGCEIWGGEWECSPLTSEDAKAVDLLSNELLALLNNAIYEFFKVYYWEEDPEDWIDFINPNKYTFVEPFYQVLFDK